tara:strand:+ start:17427 stop:17804 length:378 start_codon:yes stop_codon:yes gene_type:complete
MANTATVTTSLSITSKNATSDVIDIKINDVLVVLKDVSKKRLVLSSTAGTRLITATETSKSYIFLNNVSSYIIKIIRMYNGDEYMHLSPGQWAWIPWSATLNLEAISLDGTPTLEVMLFELGHTK